MVNKCYNARMKKSIALALALLSFPLGATERVLLDSQIIANLPIDHPQLINEIVHGKWSYAIFDPEKVPVPTRYEIVSDQGRHALQATAVGGASFFYLKFEAPLDLNAATFLIFDWRIDESPIHGPPEDTKDGDDFAFRIYLSAGGKLRSKMLNLVRAREKAVGTLWPSPYKRYNNFLRRVQIRAFVNADTENDIWHRQAVNVATWWREIFATDPIIVGGVEVARFREIKLAENADTKQHFCGIPQVAYASTGN